MRCYHPCCDRREGRLRVNYGDEGQHAAGKDPHRPCPRSGRDTSPHGGRQEGVAFVRADAVRAATIGRGVQGRVVTPFPSFPLKGEGECDVLIHIVISLQVNALRVNLTSGLAVTIIDLDVWG